MSSFSSPKPRVAERRESKYRRNSRASFSNLGNILSRRSSSSVVGPSRLSVMPSERDHDFTSGSSNNCDSRFSFVSEHNYVASPEIFFQRRPVKRDEPIPLPKLVLDPLHIIISALSVIILMMVVFCAFGTSPSFLRDGSIGMIITVISFLGGHVAAPLIRNYFKRAKEEELETEFSSINLTTNRDRAQSLKTVMGHVEMVQAYRCFLHQEFASENLDFLLQVNKFESMVDNIVDMADVLNSEYLDVVNISGVCKRKARDGLKEMETFWSVLEDAKMEIIEVLSQGTLARFKESMQYNQLRTKMRSRETSSQSRAFKSETKVVPLNTET